MDIKDIKMNFVKCAVFKKDMVNKKHLKTEWFVDMNFRKDTRTRIYILTSNGIIKKIGGSADAGGITSTLGAYASANTGKPSIRSFAVQSLIIKEIEMGNEVVAHVIFLDNVISVVKGLMTEETKEVNVGFKSSELACIREYENMQGEKPEWNIQEGKSKKWKDEIEKQYIKSRARSGK